jgi:hypothetical protein
MGNANGNVNEEQRQLRLLYKSEEPLLPDDVLIFTALFQLSSKNVHIARHIWKQLYHDVTHIKDFNLQMLGVLTRLYKVLVNDLAVEDVEEGVEEDEKFDVTDPVAQTHMTLSFKQVIRFEYVQPLQELNKQLEHVRTMIQWFRATKENCEKVYEILLSMFSLTHKFLVFHQNVRSALLKVSK